MAAGSATGGCRYADAILRCKGLLHARIGGNELQWGKSGPIGATQTSVALRLILMTNV
jgi:hypothetical protein